MRSRRRSPAWGRIISLIVAAVVLGVAAVTILLQDKALGTGTPAACASIRTFAPVSLPPRIVLACIVAFGAGYVWQRRPYSTREKPDAKIG
jgi:hypothetical protein